MARILFSTHSSSSFAGNAKDCFTEEFINVLIRNGHEVLYFQNNELYSCSNVSNDIFDDVKDVVRQAIESFRPELILTFNNALPGDDVLEYTNVPVLVYPADMTCFWRGKKALLKNLDRYYFLAVSEKLTDDIKKDIRPSVHRIIPFGHVTDMQKVDIMQDIAISFVGSIANYSPCTVNFWKSLADDDIETEQKEIVKDSYYKALDRFSSNTGCDMGFNMNRYITYGPHLTQDEINRESIFLLTCRERVKTLSELSELGLRIFGFPNQWPQAFQFDHVLFRCFSFIPSVTYEQNKVTYNRSKVSLNLYHANHTDGFSWRVCDILASNAVLLSNRKKDLETLLEGYLPLPMYETPAQAKDIAIKLINDDVWRRELTLSCQEMINDKCRFERYFPGIQSEIKAFKSDTKQGGSLQEFQIPVVDKDVSIFQGRIMDKIIYKLIKHFAKRLFRKKIINDFFIQLAKPNVRGF